MTSATTTSGFEARLNRWIARTSNNEDFIILRRKNINIKQGEAAPKGSITENLKDLNNEKYNQITGADPDKEGAFASTMRIAKKMGTFGFNITLGRLATISDYVFKRKVGKGKDMITLPRRLAAAAQSFKNLFPSGTAEDVSEKKTKDQISPETRKEMQKEEVCEHIKDAGELQTELTKQESSLIGIGRKLKNAKNELEEQKALETGVKKEIDDLFNSEKPDLQQENLKKKQKELKRIEKKRGKTEIKVTRLDKAEKAAIKAKTSLNNALESINTALNLEDEDKKKLKEIVKNQYERDFLDQKTREKETEIAKLSDDIGATEQDLKIEEEKRDKYMYQGISLDEDQTIDGVNNKITELKEKIGNDKKKKEELENEIKPVADQEEKLKGGARVKDEFIQKLSNDFTISGDADISVEEAKKDLEKARNTSETANKSAIEKTELFTTAETKATEAKKKHTNAKEAVTKAETAAKTAEGNVTTQKTELTTAQEHLHTVGIDKRQEAGDNVKAAKEALDAAKNAAEQATIDLKAKQKAEKQAKIEAEKAETAETEAEAAKTQADQDKIEAEQALKAAKARLLKVKARDAIEDAEYKVREAKRAKETAEEKVPDDIEDGEGLEEPPEEDINTENNKHKEEIDRLRNSIKGYEKITDMGTRKATKKDAEKLAKLLIDTMDKTPQTQNAQGEERKILAELNGPLAKIYTNTKFAAALKLQTYRIDNGLNGKRSKALLKDLYDAIFIVHGEKKNNKPDDAVSRALEAAQEKLGLSTP